MRRRPLPHSDIVAAIRERVAHGRSLASINISDDMDQWYVGLGAPSPMDRQTESVCAAFDEARSLGLKLVEIGEPAAPAVAKGLRTAGSWRENLLPFAEKFRDVPVIREALELISKRMRDSLCPKACEILGVKCESPLAGGGWRERRRKMRRWLR